MSWSTLLKTAPRKGYSLVEVLIGMTILAIVLLGTFYLTFNNSRQMQTTQYMSAAANLAEYKIEELRNEDYDIITAGSDPGAIDELGEAGGRFQRSWTVVDDTPDVDMKTVTVTVSWQQWGETRIFTLSGVIGR